MNSTTLEDSCEISKKAMSMHEFGEIFIEELDKHIGGLKIPGRLIERDVRRKSFPAKIEQITEIQHVMREVLHHETTQEAHESTELAFTAFLKKEKVDDGVLKFFNGWNETHKTTSLVSAKIIMRLSADAISISAEKQMAYSTIMAHMHEVAKDDFGLGHDGHDGMYSYMTAAFRASDWVESRYAVNECNEFSEFLYKTGVAKHKSAMGSTEHKHSIMDAMMVSISSELWNGREYNFIAQYIEDKLQSIKSSFDGNANGRRYAKSYIMGHSGEVENRHGLHALAAAQTFGHALDLNFETDRLKHIMLDYNKRAGKAFRALHEALSN